MLDPSIQEDNLCCPPPYLTKIDRGIKICYIANTENYSINFKALSIETKYVLNLSNVISKFSEGLYTKCITLQLGLDINFEMKYFFQCVRRERFIDASDKKENNWGNCKPAFEMKRGIKDTKIPVNQILQRQW